jgi:hypothetical protein
MQDMKRKFCPMFPSWMASFVYGDFPGFAALVSVLDPRATGPLTALEANLAY